MDIKDITLEDLKEQRPDLYQMIIEERRAKPLFVNEDDIETILKPLFSEFERRASVKIADLEKELQREIKKKLSDGMKSLNNLVEYKINKSKRTVANSKKRYAVVGETIRWKPTGETGKVVRFAYSGAVRKLVLKVKQGEYIEVYDNKTLYDILLEKN